MWFISNKLIIWFRSKESKELTSVWFISKKSIIWFRSAESRESHLSWTPALNYDFCDCEFCAQGSLDNHTYKVHGIQTEKETLHKHYHAVHEGRKTYKKSHWILKIHVESVHDEKTFPQCEIGNSDNHNKKMVNCQLCDDEFDQIFGFGSRFNKWVNNFQQFRSNFEITTLKVWI